MSDPSQAAASPIDRLVLTIGRAAMWLFLLAILVSGYEVAMRYLFNAPSTWAHVATTTLCAIGFAFGGAWSMVRREHIRVDFVPERAGPKGRRLIEIVSLVVGLFYLLGLGYGLWLDAAGSIWRFDWQGRWIPELTPGPPNWPTPSIIKAALLLGAGLFALVCAAQLFRALARRRTP